MEEIIFDQDFFKKLNTLKMALKMRLSQGMSGARKSSAKGSSVEFSDFREYLLGDDIRRIDWNAYGRTDKLYIKQFMEEKEASFNIFVDTSASMNFGEPKKSMAARQLAGAFAYVALNNLDRVYVNALNENSYQRGKGMAGAAAFSHILKDLERMEFDGGTSINRAIMSRPLAAGGVSIIISDFLDYDGVEEALRYLAYRKQTILLCQILSKQEVEPEYEGTLMLKDMENSNQMKVTMSNAAIKAYYNELSGLKARLKNVSLKYGAGYHFIRSDESLVTSILYGFSGVFAGR